MDLRIEHIFNDEMSGDTSFTEKDNAFSRIFGNNSYSEKEMKETWNKGIKHGIEIGINRASVEGQVIELNNNTKDPKHIEFLEKFYKLAEQYKCAIQYHPQHGIVVLDKSNVYKK